MRLEVKQEKASHEDAKLKATGEAEAGDLVTASLLLVLREVVRS